MDELEEKISREIQILNSERQYMKELSADVEVGKFVEEFLLLQLEPLNRLLLKLLEKKQVLLTQSKLLHLIMIMLY